MSVKDLTGIIFEKGPKCYKYSAHLPDGRTVHFGHKAYEQYKDSVPKKQGGGIWSHKNHLDPYRRESYRKRHCRINKDGVYTKDVKYSPEWFSYYFLW